MLNRGRTPNVGLRLPLPIISVTQASKVKSVVTESQTLAAGAAGTTGNFILNYAPVFSAKGDLVASLSDSSINMNAGADLTTEISFQMALNQYLATVGNPGYQDTGSPENPPDLTAALTNGQFYVIYETGRIYYKKASNGGTASITYNIRILEIEATFAGNVSENLAQVGGVTVVTGGLAGSQGVGGLAAAGAAVVGNPVLIGVKDGSGNVKTVTLGQATSANSIPVVLPSDAAANSGSASSGDNTYMSPFDFTVAYASATTLTITPPATFTPSINEYVSVKIQDTSGVSKTYTPDVNAFSLSGATLTVAGATFTATDVFIVTVLGPGKKVIYNSTPPTLTNGQYAPTQSDARGNQLVSLASGANTVLVTTAGADGVSNTQNELETQSRLQGYNGTTWDRVRTGLTAVITTFTGVLANMNYGMYNSTPPSPANGNGVPLQTDARGNLFASLASGANAVAVTTAGADAVSNTQNELEVQSRLQAFNGTTWDRVKSGQTAAQTGATGFQNNLPFLQYNTSAPAPTNGQIVVLQGNSAGALNVDETLAAQGEDNTNGVFAMQVKPLAVNTYSYTTTQNLSFTTLNLKASAGNVYSLSVFNSTASVRYLQLHNTATTPGGGATAFDLFLVPPNGQTIVDAQYFGPGGMAFATGIAYANSTTAGTYTAGSAGDLLLRINSK